MNKNKKVSQADALWAEESALQVKGDAKKK